MKKRITLITIALALVVSSVFALTACGGKKISEEQWNAYAEEAAKLHNYKVEIVKNTVEKDQGNLVAKTDYTDANGVEVKVGDFIDAAGNKVEEAVKGEVEVNITTGMVYQRSGNLAYCSRVYVGFNDMSKNVADEFYLEFGGNNGEVVQSIIQLVDRKWVRTTLTEEESEIINEFSVFMTFLDTLKFSDFEYGRNGYGFSGNLAENPVISSIFEIKEGSDLVLEVRFGSKGISGYDFMIKKGKTITDSARLSNVGTTKVKLPKEIN